MADGRVKAAPDQEGLDRSRQLDVVEVVIVDRALHGSPGRFFQEAFVGLGTCVFRALQTMGIKGSVMLSDGRWIVYYPTSNILIRRFSTHRTELNQHRELWGDKGGIEISESCALARGLWPKNIWPFEPGGMHGCWFKLTAGQIRAMHRKRPA